MLLFNFIGIFHCFPCTLRIGGLSPVVDFVACMHSFHPYIGADPRQHVLTIYSTPGDRLKHLWAPKWKGS